MMTDNDSSDEKRDSNMRNKSRMRPLESFEDVFLSPDVVLNLHWTLAFSVLMGFTAIFTIFVSAAAGLAPAIQAYPPYSFTWTMLFPTALLWIPGVLSTTLRSADFTFAVFILYLLLVVLNVSLVLLQFIGIFVDPVVFFTRSGWFGAFMMGLVTILSTVAFFGVLPVYLALARRAGYIPGRKWRATKRIR